MKPSLLLVSLSLVFVAAGCSQTTPAPTAATPPAPAVAATPLAATPLAATPLAATAPPVENRILGNCPISGVPVRDGEVQGAAKWNGKTWYFCTLTCKQLFLQAHPDAVEVKP